MVLAVVAVVVVLLVPVVVVPVVVVPVVGCRSVVPLSPTPTEVDGGIILCMVVVVVTILLLMLRLTRGRKVLCGLAKDATLDESKNN